MGKLILTRRLGERLFLDTKDGRITLEIIKIGSGVKLAVEAPKAIVVLREEVEQRGGQEHVSNRNHLR